MILFLILATIVVVCVVLFVCDIGSNDAMVACIVVAGIILCIVGGILPCIRADIKAEIVAFNQVEQDINVARRSKLDPVERASLTNTVISNNKWLAKKQFRNAGAWDIFIPDEVDNLKKLK